MLHESWLIAEIGECYGKNGIGTSHLSSLQFDYGQEHIDSGLVICVNEQSSLAVFCFIIVFICFSRASMRTRLCFSHWRTNVFSGATQTFSKSMQMHACAQSFEAVTNMVICTLIQAAFHTLFHLDISLAVLILLQTYCDEFRCDAISTA